MSRLDGIGGRGDWPGRTLLVVADDGELAVALRDRLDRAYLTVCDAADVGPAVTRGRWPWMVVGHGAEMSEPVAGCVAAHPVLVLWHGMQPRGLPAHARAFALFSELTRAVAAALDNRVAGIRVAPGAGLTMPDGGHCGNAALEALVANHPHPIFAPKREFRRAAAALASHRVPLRVAHAGGGVLLAPGRVA